MLQGVLYPYIGRIPKIRGNPFTERNSRFGWTKQSQVVYECSMDSNFCRLFKMRSWELAYIPRILDLRRKKQYEGSSTAALSTADPRPTKNDLHREEPFSVSSMTKYINVVNRLYLKITEHFQHQNCSIFIIYGPGVFWYSLLNSLREKKKKKGSLKKDLRILIFFTQ